MPIGPFLQGKTFDPEATQTMGTAFDQACRSIGLGGNVNGATWIVAKKIVELASAGERDPVRLRDGVLAYFGIAPPLTDERLVSSADDRPS